MTRYRYNALDIDYDAVTDAAISFDTDKQIAEQLGVCRRTFHYRKQKDKKFLEAYNEGRAIWQEDVKQEIFSIQLQYLRAGGRDGRTLAIFLGKALLNQRDIATNDNPADNESLTQLTAAMEKAAKTQIKKSKASE